MHFLYLAEILNNRRNPSWPSEEATFVQPWCFRRPIWTNPRYWCTTKEEQSTKPDQMQWNQIRLADNTFWVTHQQRFCLDLVWSIEHDQSVEIIPERQTKRFGIQLRIAKLQINKLALPESQITFVLRLCCRDKIWEHATRSYSCCWPNRTSCKCCDHSLLLPTFLHWS